MKANELYNEFDRRYIKIVLPYIELYLPKNKFSDPIWYILNRFDWRRFRSGLPLLFAEKYNVPLKNMLPIAAASEIIFAIALVQDDIVDDDKNRGEFPATHMIFGIPHTISACDYTYAYVNELLEDKNLNLEKDIASEIKLNFAKSQKDLYMSFIIETLSKKNINFSKKDILDVYLKKTATGIYATHSAALLCNNAPNSFAKDILKYSRFLAIAGQIKNDIYDLVSWQKYPMFRGYSDLKNGYITYAIRKLLDETSGRERQIVINAIKTRKEYELLKLIKDYNIIKKCIQDCHMYANKAINVIKGKYIEVEDILLAWALGHKRFTKLDGQVRKELKLNLEHER